MTTVDMTFPVVARPDTVLDADHAYALYGALCRALESDSHDHGFVAGVLPVTGDFIGNRQLLVTQFSRMRLRLDHDHVPEFLKLAGHQIAVRGTQLRFGVPTIRPLEPLSRLYSRLVTIKGAIDAESLLIATQTELERLDIDGMPRLVERQNAVPLEAAHPDNSDAAHQEPSAESNEGDSPRDPFIRRTVRIRDKEVVGYAMMVEGLSATDSIRLQTHGLGGRRHFGCGVFVKAR
ncbi:MAG: type I-MYXAN CRISPR-associated protein Cas6/Cmx6 [Planctomycetota bacterium]